MGKGRQRLRKMKEVELPDSSLSVCFKTKLDCFSWLATAACRSLLQSLVLQRIREEILLQNWKCHGMKITPADPDDGGSPTTNLLGHPWELGGGRGDSNSQKFLPRLPNLWKMQALSWASSHVSLMHLSFQEQDTFSPLHSLSRSCRAQFPSVNHHLKPKCGQLKRILLKFHHYNNSTTGKNKTQRLVVISHQKPWKQKACPKYQHRSFAWPREAKAMWCEIVFTASSTRLA